VSKAAEILKVRRATPSDLLHGKAALTPKMALCIEKAFGPDMDHLLRMQLAYDVAKTREHARDISIKRSSWHEGGVLVFLSLAHRHVQSNLPSPPIWLSTQSLA
jgi:addiction module HigA family antidote